jgi:hypothetical protein
MQTVSPIFQRPLIGILLLNLPWYAFNLFSHKCTEKLCFLSQLATFRFPPHPNPTNLTFFFVNKLFVLLLPPHTPRSRNISKLKYFL